MQYIPAKVASVPKKALLVLAAALMIATGIGFYNAESASAATACPFSGGTVRDPYGRLHSKYNCYVFRTAPIFNNPGTYRTQIGVNYAGTNWVACMHYGAPNPPTRNSNGTWNYSNVWFYTIGDTTGGRWGWMPATYVRGNTYGVRIC